MSCTTSAGTPAAAHFAPPQATLIWSAKESALKARRTGLRADTRAVEVRLAGDRPGGRAGLLSIRCLEPEERLRGCWWVADGYVFTIVAAGGACNPEGWIPAGEDLTASG